MPNFRSVTHELTAGKEGKYITFSATAPSRLCLFGEHQDYLNLAVIAAAIDLRFTARVTPRDDHQLHILIRSSAIKNLNQNHADAYDEIWLNLQQQQRYAGQRDYLKSSINVLQRHGFSLPAADLILDSDIPIGKGMCSSSAMILALIHALLVLANANIANDPLRVAELAWEAEVKEFAEPGGRMDHYTSALGGLLHLDFACGDVAVENLNVPFQGNFILFDTLEPKDTLRALSGAKQPTLAALKYLESAGIVNLRDLLCHADCEALMQTLPDVERRCLQANIANRLLFDEALTMFRSGKLDEQRFGAMLTAHHRQLADGLSLSTEKLEQILATACAAGAWGGKLNGSGGGGCLFVYAPRHATDEIIAQVAAIGYPGRVLSLSEGLKAKHK